MCKRDRQWSAFCFHLVDIPIRHKRLVFTILISVLTCSISCAYHSGNVSLSPIVNRMALGRRNYALAIAVAVYFPNGRSSQFWDAISTGAANILATIIIGPATLVLNILCTFIKRILKTDPYGKDIKGSH
jgi:hypothetical protein